MVKEINSNGNVTIRIVKDGKIIAVISANNISGCIDVDKLKSMRTINFGQIIEIEV